MGNFLKLFPYLFALAFFFYIASLRDDIVNISAERDAYKEKAEQREKELAAQSKSIEACLEREEETRLAEQERNKLVSGLKYQLKQAQGQGELCNELEEESRNLIIDRLNRPYEWVQ